MRKNYRGVFIRRVGLVSKSILDTRTGTRS